MKLFLCVVKRDAVNKHFFSFLTLAYFKIKTKISVTKLQDDIF